ncbi:30S ribosomal protein S9 [Candidatus Woesearchaeota archaeon]|nr:MAG: 30S ribosomal protein S9 [Candidatus Woesearchaeota archaeon]
MSKLVHVSGKRKMAVARATVKEGKGVIRINGKLLENYNPEVLRLSLMEPLLLAGDVAKKVDVKINVHGGGISAQTAASRLALARGLVEFTGSKKLKKTFFDYDRNLLVADVRRNEPHKPNDSKPRAKRQKSYR